MKEKGALTMVPMQDEIDQQDNFNEYAMKEKYLKKEVISDANVKSASLPNRTSNSPRPALAVLKRRTSRWLHSSSVPACTLPMLLAAPPLMAAPCR
mgnify:CR=1 FL=1